MFHFLFFFGSSPSSLPRPTENGQTFKKKIDMCLRPQQFKKKRGREIFQCDI